MLCPVAEEVRRLAACNRRKAISFYYGVDGILQVGKGVKERSVQIKKNIAVLHILKPRVK